TQAPDEGGHGAQAQDDRGRGEKQQDGHRRRLTRKALRVTTSDEPDIARAATNGLTKPSMAAGAATRLYRAAKPKFSSARRRAERAMSIAAATGDRVSPDSTRSAAFWLASSALPGAMAACALDRAAASFSPSPTISTRRPPAASRSMAAALSCGVWAARQRSIPTARATG